MEKLIERLVKVWLNKNRPDLLVTQNLVKMITDQIIKNVNVDTDINEIEHFTAEYLSINFSESLVLIIENVVEDNFPAIKKQWKDYGLYSEEISQILNKLAYENVGENYLKLQGNEFIYSDEIKNEILNISKKHIEENW